MFNDIDLVRALISWPQAHFLATIVSVHKIWMQCLLLTGVFLIDLLHDYDVVKLKVKRKITECSNHFHYALIDSWFLWLEKKEFVPTLMAELSMIKVKAGWFFIPKMSLREKAKLSC